MSFPYILPLVFPNGAVGGALTGAGLLDHQALAFSKLAEYLKNKPNVVATLAAFAQPAVDVETAFQGLYQNRTVANAQGIELDRLGKIVGELRNGRDDPTYRPFVQARSLLNKSSGCPEELYSLFKVLTPPGTVLQIYHEGIAAFALQMTVTLFVTAQITNLLAMLRLARSGGVRGILEWQQVNDAGSFSFAAGPGLGFGDSTTPATGGALTGAST